MCRAMTPNEHVFSVSESSVREYIDKRPSLFIHEEADSKNFIN